MVVIEGTSLRQPTEWRDLRGLGHTVVSTKRPSPNTDYLGLRCINWRKPQYSHIPLLLYKFDRPTKGRTPSLDNIYRADWRKWDKYFKEFKPKKHPDPSSGTCAALCAIERWDLQPEDELGIIGMDWVMDNNKLWFHDARAEREMLESLVTLVDLRDIKPSEVEYDEKTLSWVIARRQSA